MPKLEEAVGKIKTKSYRSWDEDLLSSLKINKDSNESADQDSQPQKHHNSHHKKLKKLSPEQSRKDLHFQTNDEMEEITTPILQDTPPINDNCANQIQSGFNQGSNGVQSGFNQGSNGVQSGFNQGSNGVQSGFNQGSNESQKISKLTQDSAFLDLEETINLIARLSRNEKTIFKLVVDKCLLNGKLETGLIPGNSIDTAIESTKNSRETAIKRLVKKDLLIRLKGSTRAGMLNLALPKKIKTITSEAYNNCFTSRVVSTNLSNRVQLGFNNHISSSNINTTTYLYENINLVNIKKALKSSHIPSGQFFDKGSLKAIFKANKGELTPDKVQASIDAFAYGLENHFDSPPYNTMKEPGAVLFKKLKQGEEWEEPRYLTPAEQDIKKYYNNIVTAFSKNESQHFSEWIKINRDKIYEKIKEKLPSNYHLSENDFMEKAKQHFKDAVLPGLRMEHALNILGEDKKALLEKIEKIKVEK